MNFLAFLNLISKQTFLPNQETFTESNIAPPSTTNFLKLNLIKKCFQEGYMKCLPHDTAVTRHSWLLNLRKMCEKWWVFIRSQVFWLCKRAFKFLKRLDTSIRSVKRETLCSEIPLFFATPLRNAIQRIKIYVRKQPHSQPPPGFSLINKDKRFYTALQG